MEEFKRISRDLVAKGAIIDYYQDTMQIPNGNIAKWDLIDHKGAAAVVAVREDGKLLMVRQYRNALERETLEIPAGGLNGREEPTDQAAMRELQEETGYHTDHVELLTSIYTTVAFCNEKIDIYLARGLKDRGIHQCRGLFRRRIKADDLRLQDPGCQDNLRHFNLRVQIPE